MPAPAAASGCRTPPTAEILSMFPVVQIAGRVQFEELFQCDAVAPLEPVRCFFGRSQIVQNRMKLHRSHGDPILTQQLQVAKLGFGIG